MPITQKYRITFLAKVTRSVPTRGAPFAHPLNGVDVKCVPILGEDHDTLQGIHPHTPGGSIAFECYAAEALSWQEGDTLLLTVAKG